MMRWSRLLAALLAVALALPGCRITAPGEDEEPPAEGAHQAAEAVHQAADTAAPAPAPPAPAAPAPAATTEPTVPPPPVAGQPLEGVVLNPKDGVQIILPDGWEQMSSDDGSLLQMVRREPVGEVRVTVNLDYGVDEKLPEGTKLSTIEQEFISRLPATLAERKFKLLDSKHVTVAGYPALVIRGDLEADGRAFRMKQYLILQDTRFWTLSTIGPRDAFDQKVEPEFDAIAATLKLQ